MRYINVLKFGFDITRTHLHVLKIGFDKRYLDVLKFGFDITRTHLSTHLCVFVTKLHTGSDDGTSKPLLKNLQYTDQALAQQQEAIYLLHNIDFGSGIKPFNKYKYFH